MIRNISILGSTGSIGTQTLEILARDPEARVIALAALKNTDKMEEQINAFHPSVVCIYDEESAAVLRNRLSNSLQDKAPRVLSGMEGLIACACAPEAELVVAAVVGMIGIRPVMEAIRAHKDIALANKETLVCAGHLIMPLAAAEGVRIIPVDSEHSAIYQCLLGESHGDVEKLLLTASGGPFRDYSPEQLKDVRPADALKHPNWSMGAKITIDSSTMVNKALEVMEASWLFDMPVCDIQVIIQPQSVIHSMVQFRDGCVKAQLGVPSMAVPIAYAIYGPKRMPFVSEDRLDFAALKKLDFLEPDRALFRGFTLGLEAAEEAGTMPTVFNAANEEAVAAFLREKIGYTDIPGGIEAAMRQHHTAEHPELEDILAAEAWARAFIRERYAL